MAKNITKRRTLNSSGDSIGSSHKDPLSTSQLTSDFSLESSDNSVIQQSLYSSEYEDHSIHQYYPTTVTPNRNAYTDPHQNQSRSKTPAPSPRHKRVPTPVKKENSSNSIKIVILGIAVIVFAIVFWLSTATPPDECQIALRRLRDEHPEQDNYMINSIVIASRALRAEQDPVHSIVLLYSSASSPSFIADVIASAGHCTPTGKSNPVVLHRQNFTDQMERDPGYVLTTFGDQLKKESIMLVNDVNLLPDSLAPAFHTICDSEFPWAKPATIYFSIEIPETANTNDENLDRLAVRILKDQWKQLPANILDPLITRITDQVLYVH